MKQTHNFIGLLSLFLVAIALPVQAVDGVYLGGQLGAVGLTGARSGNSAIGFGVDLGLQANSVVDVVFHFQTSSHTGVTIYAPTLSAEIHYAQMNDFDFTLGAGPGFYFFKGPLSTDSNFGINFGTAADLKLDEAIRLGMGVRYNVVFSPAVGTNFWSFMIRAGYFFEM